MSLRGSAHQEKFANKWHNMLFRTLLAGCILAGEFFFNDSVLANQQPVASPIYLKGKLIPVDYVELAFGSARGQMKLWFRKVTGSRLEPH